ncbi:hypothetical protein V474_15630 [Novosphingobium barchaimii LL02]|uniref:Uncharacterized protein n=1 Tax=Novosphingobium barchaimii LL02 TaxID=1114963 RepID=A0A0J7XYT8_9SPHN|nr:hypothetical protein V474_15630 [Novosphingobium barchaimii LL02]
MLPSAVQAQAPKATLAAESRLRRPFPSFFSDFQKAVLADDRERVADMTALPFKDFSGAEPARSADTRADLLKNYARIFTPAVIAGIREGRFRAFRPGSDDGEAPGPIVKGEYLLDLPNETDQIVFIPWGGSYKMGRIPFYS